MRNFLTRAFCVAAMGVSFAFAETTITLKTDFVKGYMNRVTINGTFVVDKALARPHRIASSGDDGDIHIAVRAQYTDLGPATDLGLPAVAEIMNADNSDPAIVDVHANEGTSTSMPFSGIWRLWPEHAGTDVENQGDSVPQSSTTNPAHLFEVHPVLSLNGHSEMSSIAPIDGYSYHDEGQAFNAYDNVKCHINATDSTITITTGSVGFNYVKCEIRPDLAHKVAGVPDGTICPAEILDQNGETIARNVYIVAAKGTDAEARILNWNGGSAPITIQGTPRISLARIWWRTQHSNDPRDPMN